MVDQVIGSWWQADDPELRLTGHLEVDDSGKWPWPWRLTVLCGAPDSGFAEPQQGWDATTTLFGQTDRGRYTLLSAVTGETRSSFHGVEATHSADWHAPVLLAGDYVTVETRFRQANFTYPHLIAWFAARHNSYVDTRELPGDKSWELLHQVQLNSGATLAVTLERRRQATWTTTSHTWSASYTLVSTEGATVGELNRIRWGLGRLQALMLDTDVDATQTTLTHDDETGTVEIVEPHPPAGHDWSGISPLFSADEVEVGPFLNRWLEVSESAPMIIAVAAPREGTPVMEGELQDLCNAAEWLYARIAGPEASAGLSASDNAILDAMASAGFNNRQRSRVTYLMSQSGKTTLEHKLGRLAAMLGAESATWLLGSVKDWAYTVMQVRNSLTHGFPVPGQDDLRQLGDAMLTLTVVLQFALLNHCGYTNASGPVPGEMLHAGGQPLRGTRDAAITGRAEDLASRSAEWSQRASRLRAATARPSKT